MQTCVCVYTQAMHTLTNEHNKIKINTSRERERERERGREGGRENAHSDCWRLLANADAL